MPAAHEVIQRLEGLAATFTDSNGNPTQLVADWVESMKSVLRSPTVRNRTDIDVVGTTIDLDETEEEIDTGASTLFGVLGIVKGANDDMIFSWYNVATGTDVTLSSGDLNDGGVLAGSFVVRNASATATNYGGVVFPGGQVCATGLKIGMSERDEGSTGANEGQAFVVWATN